MIFVVFGAFFGATGIILGAYGAHGLKKRAGEDLQRSFENGVRYQQMHALLVVALGLYSKGHGDTVNFWLVLCGWLITAGVILFSGSIYTAVFSGNSKITNITPIGGILFILGWISLGIFGISGL